MDLLVLGGTMFLSRAVAADALARGHRVTCACRGTSGSVPDGASLLRWDRSGPPPEGLDGRTFDAVVDAARHPSRVRTAVDLLPDAHWVFVSTINVYADESTPGGRPGALPLRDEVAEDVDLAEDPDAYGAMKVACERLVLEGARSAAVVRPGLIVGPGDPTGRFSYWPQRVADGGEVLAPGSPEDVVQVIDVRDLAAWLVTLAEQRTEGVYDGVGEPLPIRDLLAACAVGAAPGSAATYTWVAQERLQALGVEPWMGKQAVPLWLPRPEYDGMLAHDPTPSLEAGLRLRPLEETSRDTLAWLRATPDAPVTGISREREQQLLAAVREG